MRNANRRPAGIPPDCNLAEVAAFLAVSELRRRDASCTQGHPGRRRRCILPIQRPAWVFGTTTLRSAAEPEQLSAVRRLQSAQKRSSATFPWGKQAAPNHYPCRLLQQLPSPNQARWNARRSRPLSFDMRRYFLRRTSARKPARQGLNIAAASLRRAGHTDLPTAQWAAVRQRGLCELEGMGMHNQSRLSQRVVRRANQGRTNDSLNSKWHYILPSIPLPADARRRQKTRTLVADAASTPVS